MPNPIPYAAGLVVVVVVVVAAGIVAVVLGAIAAMGVVHRFTWSRERRRRAGLRSESRDRAAYLDHGRGRWKPV